MKTLVPVEVIERKIYLIRGEKVILSSDLAQLYGVEPKVLIQAVKRNIERFPEDFMFQLTNQEFILTFNNLSLKNESLRPTNP
ncbi:MAG: ORF6N domain-containing protein, partial [Thermodesulfovibrionales bacterium]|nr:ORF6N domain-containing protein [Thermodesulfovibrionales bacterium]